MKVPTCKLCHEEKYQLQNPFSKRSGFYCPQCNGWTSTVWREEKQ